VTLEHLWAGWRTAYVSAAGAEGPQDEGCVFCRILASGEPDDVTKVVWRSPGGDVVAMLNAYPYTSGHLMVMPVRHAASLDDLDAGEAAEVWATVQSAVRSLQAAYSPDGINLGANLGRAAGAGIPGHVHVHVLPRWTGDTNFMTTVAGVRVMPESLDESWSKVTAAWSPPASGGGGG